MAGMAMHKVTVGIFSPATDRTVWLELGDVTDRYFTNSLGVLTANPLHHGGATQPKALRPRSL